MYLRGRTGDDCKAGFGGVFKCGAIWVCPICSAKVARERVGELDKLLTWNTSLGGSAGMVTFTASHHKGQRLKTLLKAMQKAWSRMTTGRAGQHWRNLKELLGVHGYVRALETVYRDQNGWHPHFHLLLLFDGPVAHSAVEGFTDLLYGLWEKALASQGMTASRRHGVNLRLSTGTAESLELLGEYLAKMTFEIAGGRFKSGRKSSAKDGGEPLRTPFEILADGLETGLADDFDLWWEWEEAIKGSRQLLWSRGLKAAAGIKERTDEEIAEAADEGETLLVIPRSSWKKVRLVQVELLEATEAGGVGAAMVWMDERGLFYEVPDVGFLSDRPKEPGTWERTHSGGRQRKRGRQWGLQPVG